MTIQSEAKLVNNLSLKTKLLLVVVAACFICASVSISGFLYFNKKELVEGIINKERTIHTQLAAATEFVARQGGLEDSIIKYSAKYKSSDEITEAESKDILSRVPIYASLVIGKKNAEVDHYNFRVFSDEPRRKENLASAVEMKIFEKFKSNSTLEEFIENDGENVTLFRPVRLSKNQGCLTCHGNPNLSPWKNGKDILGYKMENWEDGHLHGVFAVSQNIDEVSKASMAGKTISPAGWLILAIITGAVLAVLIGILIVSDPIRQLSGITKSLNVASQRVTGFSSDVAESSQILSQAATQQAASLEQTSASLEQITAMIAKSAGNAKEAATSTTESLKIVGEGQAAVSQMVKSMDEIQTSQDELAKQVEGNNNQMSEILGVIHEINAKTKVINEIVFQTKLLSFNASVEAARAGEHGKGFSVVAEEIGNLARMSGDSSKQIANMLDGGITKVEKIVKTSRSDMEKFLTSGKERVELGVSQANRCSAVLKKILANAEHVSLLAAGISQSSLEQAQGITEINKALNQLDMVTQQNTATSETTASAAHELSEQGKTLSTVLEKLNETVSGGAVYSKETGFDTRSVSVDDDQN